jgi:hypothetical protein
MGYVALQWRLCLPEHRMAVSFGLNLANGKIYG